MARILGAAVTILVWGTILTADAVGQDFKTLQTRCATSKNSLEKLQSCSVLIENARDNRTLERAFLGRGHANIALERFRDAAEDFSNVIRINPRIAGYYDNRQWAYKSAGLLNEALSDAHSAVRLAPTGHSFVYRSRAFVYVDMNRYSEAIADFNMALQISPSDAGIYVERGKILAKTGSVSAAMNDFNRAIMLDNTLVEVFKLRGLLLASAGKYMEARADLIKFLTLRPDDQEAVARLPAIESAIAEERKAEAIAQETRIRAIALRASEEELRRKEEQAKAIPQLAQGQSHSSPSTQLSNVEALKLSSQLGGLESEIKILRSMLSEQKLGLNAASAGTRQPITVTIRVIEARVASLEKAMASSQRVFDNYLTSVHPNDRQQFITARRGSEIFPKIPFFIPGTNEVGEFWIEPQISEKGAMLFAFHFIDPQSQIQKTRGKIELSLTEMQEFQKGLLKLHEWSETAHKEKIRKSFEKRVVCFPVAECPEGEAEDGKSSTELRFNIYEDGATAGRIQRNKGRFVEGYNMSIESSMLLQAYIGYVVKKASEEYRAGRQNRRDLDSLFK